MLATPQGKSSRNARVAPGGDKRTCSSMKHQRKDRGGIGPAAEMGTEAISIRRRARRRGLGVDRLCGMETARVYSLESGWSLTRSTQGSTTQTCVLLGVTLRWFLALEDTVSTKGSP